MHPPKSLKAKNLFLYLVIATGLFSGILITTLIWLQVPEEIITPLFWLCLTMIGLGSFLYLRRTTSPCPRWIIVLAAFAAVSLVYLFPEMFGPACGGMPRAFALNCPAECRIKECTKWVAGPSTECPNPGSGGGCCLEYVTVCDKDCEPEPPPNQPPTITGSVTCSQWGKNGWCINSAILELTAIEPQGKSLQISGDVGGTPFSCPNGNGTVSCSVLLPEGAATVNYLATSITTLTDSGSKSYKFDSKLPQINGTLNGISGTNGWYISPVDVNASASDPGSGSGMAAFEYNLNGSGWENYTGPLSLSDGVHTLGLRASDLAGNSVETDQTIQVDTITPALNLSVTGTSGSNGWYTSNIQIDTTASDAGSGVRDLEYDLDGAGWTPYSGTLELTDGSHSLNLRAIDVAGNLTEGTQNFSVDTLAPTIDPLEIGTAGTNGWYISDVQVSALANDIGSGLSLLEVSADNGSFNAYSEPLTFSDGLHSYQFRATDNAGNLAESTYQQVSVDTILPVIDLPESWKLGQTTTFKLQDDGSGLGSVRLVVEDEDERFPKVAWEKKLKSHKFKGEIDWNGRFKDGQLAPQGGEYYAWVKVSDAAGNERMQAGQIIVPIASIVEELLLPSGDQTDGLVSGTETPGQIEEHPVPQTSMSDLAVPSESSATNNPPPISFGGDSNGAAQPSVAQAGMTKLNAGGQSNTPVSSSHSNILWGATATAAIGAFAAEAARRKAARRAANAKINQARKLKQQAYALSQQLKKQKDAIDQALRNQAAYARVLGRKEVGIEKELRSHLTRAQAERDAYERAKQEAYDIYRKQEVAAQKKITPPKEKEKKWWQKAIDWVDSNQVATSIGIGVAIGLGAAAIILTSGVAVPIVIIGALAVAGGITGGGTIALNTHYGRGWNENLTRNLVLSLGATTLTAGITVVGANVLGAGITFCTMNPSCANLIDPVMKTIDFIEEASLVIKSGVQTFFGDSTGAGETLLELEMEHMDGGLPGNSLAKELGSESVEILAKYGDDAIELIGKYGDDAIDMIIKYGDDAIDIIGSYGDEGISLLSAYGDDAINIISKIERLPDSALEKAWEQGPDAMKALSYWDEEELIKYGEELVSRAPQDAKVLKAASELARIKNIDSDEAQELIKTIAENSIIGDGDRLILGKWVEGSLDDGFIGKARSENALFYGTNPGLQKIIDSMDSLSSSEKEKLFWSVNEQVLQKAVDSKWKVDYSFNGFDSDEIAKEIEAIETIAAGQGEEVVGILGKFPFRMREVEFLVNQGYKYEIDTVAQAVHWIKP